MGEIAGPRSRSPNTRGDGEREVPERLAENHAVIAFAGSRNRRVAAACHPVERTAIDDHAADGVAVAAEILGQGVNDDVGAVVLRLEQVGGGQRVVDNQRNPSLFRHGRHRFDIGDDSAGIGDRLNEDRLRLRRYGRTEALRVRRIGPFHMPVEFLEGLAELVDGTAIELPAGDELGARLHQRMEDDSLGRVAGSDGECGGAAFESRHALLEDRLGGIHDPRIDVAKGLEVEQRGGMIDVVEDKRCRLVDGRRPGARRSIRLRACVNGECIEPRRTLFGHREAPLSGPVLR